MILLIGLCSLSYVATAIWWNIYYLIFWLGLVLGFATGAINVISLWPPWAHFGNTNGMITAISLTGYTLTPGMYGFIFTKIVNPDNLSAVESKVSTEVIFPVSVSDQVPFAMLVLGGLVFMNGVIAMLMIFDNPNKTNEDYTEIKADITYSEIFKSQHFWRIFLQNYLCLLAPYLICNLRLILLMLIGDDLLVAYVFNITTIAMILGRLLSMYILDSTNFEVLMSIVNIGSIILCTTFPIVWSSSVLSIVWICSMYFITGGVYPAGIIEIFRNFPGENGKKVAPLLNLAWSMEMISVVGVTAIADEFGYDISFYFLSCLFMISQILLILWRPKHISTINQIELKDQLLPQ